MAEGEDEVAVEMGAAAVAAEDGAVTTAVARVGDVEEAAAVYGVVEAGDDGTEAAAAVPAFWCDCD